ncbi:MAG TPA: hypothetical protein VIT23_02295 [Terrimicrobiaceae bacterium]
MTTNANIKFPIIAITPKQKVVSVYHTLERLATCSSSALKKGYYAEMEIIDDSNKLFFVASAKKLHGVGRLWGFSLLYGRLIRVEIELSERLQTLSLDEAKKRILEVARGGTWDATEVGYLRGIRRKIQEAQSIEAIRGVIESIN